MAEIENRELKAVMSYMSTNVPPAESPIIHVVQPPLPSQTVNLNGSKKSVWIARDYIPGETGYTESSDRFHEIYPSLKDAKSKDIKKSIGKLHVKLGHKVVVKHGHWKRVLHMSFLFHDNTHVLFLPTVATVDATDPSKTIMVDFESISTEHLHHLEAVHHPDDHHIVEFRMSETPNIPPAKQPLEKPVAKQSSSLMDELLNAASEKLSEKIKKMMTDALNPK
jgi:hypothetical protein